MSGQAGRLGRVAPFTALPRRQRHEEKLVQVVISRRSQRLRSPLEINPSLVQHHESGALGLRLVGDSDLRVPLSQGRELYNALKRQGTPVELVIYPRQAHWVDEPQLLLDVRRRPVDWFERWIRSQD